MLLLKLFIQGYSKILQSDNGREFVNKILDSYLISINGIHILGSSISSSEPRINLDFK